MARIEYPEDQGGSGGLTYAVVRLARGFVKSAGIRAPEKGKANAAVEALLARTLGLPVKSVRIVSGKGSQQKLVEIEGLSAAEVRRKLDPDSG